MRAINSNEPLAVSAISYWEVALLIARGRLTISTSTDEWFSMASQVPGLSTLDVSPRVARLAGGDELQWDHRDPADRIIAATAMVENIPLITADHRLREFAAVETIW